MLSYFFFLIIQNRKIKLLILLFAIIYLILFGFLASTSDEHFNSILSAVGSVFLLTLCLVYFIHSMRLTAAPVSFFSPVFLIVVGLLIYMASTLFLYIIASQLTEKEMDQYWSINHVVNILVNIIVSLAFISIRAQRKNPTPENQQLDFTPFSDDR